VSDANRGGTGPAAVLGALVGLGLALAGFFVARAVFEARAAQRYVTVKGLAERELRANLAMWPIVFNATGDDLSAIQGELDRDAQAVAAFLAEQGFAADQSSLSPPRVTDYLAQGYRSDGGPADRYSAEATVVVRSPDVDRVLAAMQRSGELVKAGVAVLRSYEAQPQFLYTDLEAIKPEMIATATKDARRAAEQFARDSGSEVDAIRNAQQGYFSIEDRDPFSPDWKKIRVVTTVEYFLVDR
jgi:hypothetical protein